MKLKILFLILLTSIISSCKKRSENSNFENVFQQSFKTIKKDYVKTNNLNWDEIKNKIMDSIPNFRNNSDVYAGIKYTLHLLGDKHSFFLSSTDSANFLTSRNRVLPNIESKVISNDVGYLKVPEFVGKDSLVELFTTNLRKELMKLDKQQDLSGWIIDLRDNAGGKAGSIKLGLAPLFSNSVIGYSINNRGEYISQIITDTSYRYGNNYTRKIKDSDTLKNINKPIAVLVNERTASISESVALSFSFENNTKIFGRNTRGLTTDLVVYKFTSGSVFGFSTAFMCDKNKNAVKDGLEPDIKCESKEVIKKAVYWIKNAV